MNSNNPTPQLENGFTMIANEIVEALAKAMPGFTEGQILFAVLRKTYGWHKKEDKISISQLVAMINKSKRMVIYALQNLEAKKIIFIKRETLHGEKQSNIISFNKNYLQWVVQNLAPQVEKRRQHDKISSARRRSSARLGKKVVQDSVKNIQSLAHTKETIQKIITKDIIPKGITKREFGNPDINETISYFKITLGLPLLDGSLQKNRQYAYLCLKKFGGVEKVKTLINSAKANQFWSTRITSFMNLYYKAINIISSNRDQKGGVLQL